MREDYTGEVNNSFTILDEVERRKIQEDVLNPIEKIFHTYALNGWISERETYIGRWQIPNFEKGKRLIFEVKSSDQDFISSLGLQS